MRRAHLLGNGATDARRNCVDVCRAGAVGYGLSVVVAVILDIVGSRRLADRTASQLHLDESIARVHGDLPIALEPFRPTVGDEQQAVFASLKDAVETILLLQLAIPDGLALRFGLGMGAVHQLPTGSGGTISEGPGWWAARAAIDVARTRAFRNVPSLYAWVEVDPDQPANVQSVATSVNALLVMHGEAISRMPDHARRLAYGRWLGIEMRVLAEEAGISMGAASLRLRASGFNALSEATRLIWDALSPADHSC